MKPHLAVAEETGVTIAIENHGNNLIESPDSLKWLAELRPSKHLAIAFAPYHLPQDETLLGDLIRALGDAHRDVLRLATRHGLHEEAAQGAGAAADAGPRRLRFHAVACRTAATSIITAGPRSSCIPCRAAFRFWNDRRRDRGNQSTREYVTSCLG